MDALGYQDAACQRHPDAGIYRQVAGLEVSAPSATSDRDRPTSQPRNERDGVVTFVKRSQRRSAQNQNDAHWASITATPSNPRTQERTMRNPFTSEYARLTTGGRISIPLIGTVNVNGSQLFAQGRERELLAMLKYANSEEAEAALAVLSAQIDAWEVHLAGKKQKGKTPVPLVSCYAKLSNGGRILMPLIGAVNVNGIQLFVQARDGELLTMLRLLSADDAELELAALTEQMDTWERDQAEKAENFRADRPIRR
jgi:hypothetical protein